jgi:hypothetical protein
LKHSLLSVSNWIFFVDQVDQTREKNSFACRLLNIFLLRHAHFFRTHARVWFHMFEFVFSTLSVIFTCSRVIFTRSSVIFKRMSVILTRRVRFPHAKFDLDKHDCHFHTHKCDLDTHECDSYTQTCYCNTLRVILKLTN